MSEYLGTVYGKLRIPCHVYQSGVFNFDDVLCRYDPDELILPEDITIVKKQLVGKKKKESESRGAPFFDGLQCRLRNYGVRIEDPKTEKLKLVLTFGPTSWFTYSATNRSLDEKILQDNYGRKTSIRKKYIRDPLDLNDVLANSTGVSMSVISEPDHKIILVERSMKLSQYPGLYGVGAAGFMNIEKDLIGNTPNPFATTLRETKEEAGIDCSVNDIKLFGVGRAMDDLHGEIWGELRTPLSIQEILSSPKKDKYEALRFIDVPFEPKEVLRYVTRTIENIPSGVASGSGSWVISKSPKWVPAHAIATINSLEEEYGHEKVLRTLEDLI